jgi:hypothetical protein
MHHKVRNTYKMLFGRPRRRDNSDDLGVDGRKILK